MDVGTISIVLVFGLIFLLFLYRTPCSISGLQGDRIDTMASIVWLSRKF